MEGNSINMKCVSKMFSATVTWYKDGKPVYEIEEMKERIQVLPEGSLYIADTDMKDSGYYLCEITNENGDKQSAGSYLNVQCRCILLNYINCSIQRNRSDSIIILE